MAVLACADAALPLGLQLTFPSRNDGVSEESDGSANGACDAVDRLPHEREAWL